MDNIKGNSKIRKELETIVQNNNILHSYLFIGKEGIGKKKIAEEFSKKILCLDKEEHCKCKSCICFESNNHPDIQIINQEGDTIKINTIREMLQTVYEKPILSNKKVYIINDADKMTIEAQNSLLKTLEEPPEYIVIILIASNIDMILSTIKSRCTKVVFEKLANQEINDILRENNIDNNISEKMYEFFDGSIGKAIKVLEKKEIYIQLDKFIESLKTMSKIDFLTKSKHMLVKEDIDDILEYCIVLLFHLGKLQSDLKYLNCVNIVQETKNRLKANSNFDMSIDNMLFKLWEEVNEDNRRG